MPRLKDKNAGGPVQDGTEGHCGQSVGGREWWSERSPLCGKPGWARKGPSAVGGICFENNYPRVAGRLERVMELEEEQRWSTRQNALSIAWMRYAHFRTNMCKGFTVEYLNLYVMT